MLGIVTGESFAMLVLFNNMTNWDFFAISKRPNSQAVGVMLVRFALCDCLYNGVEYM